MIDETSDRQSSVWLLQAESDNEILGVEKGLSHRRSRALSARRRHNWVRIVVLVGIALNNALWYAAWRNSDRISTLLTNGNKKNHLNYFLKHGEADTIEVPFEHDWTRLEDIEVDGYRYGDIHWQPGKWSPENGSVVSISRELQAELNLDPRAAPAADDPSNVLYLVSGFHVLHCLHVVRDSLYYLNGTIEWPTPPFQWSHVLHCVEAVRQSVTCAMDPTLIPLDSVWPGIPNGQTHSCRNHDALFRWTSENAHSIPEFSAITDGPHTSEWIERTRSQQNL